MNKKTIWATLVILTMAAAAAFVFHYVNRPVAAAPAMSSADFRKLPELQQYQQIKQMADSDPIGTWQFLKNTFEPNDTSNSVHEMSHLAGESMYDKFGATAVTKCDEAFAYGCFHGATEKLLAEQGSEAIRQTQTHCAGTNAEFNAVCLQGLGRGLFSFERFDLKAALLDCRLLDVPNQNFCQTGVRLEYDFEQSGARGQKSK